MLVRCTLSYHSCHRSGNQKRPTYRFVCTLPTNSSTNAFSTIAAHCTRHHVQSYSATLCQKCHNYQTKSVSPQAQTLPLLRLTRAGLVGTLAHTQKGGTGREHQAAPLTRPVLCPDRINPPGPLGKQLPAQPFSPAGCLPARASPPGPLRRRCGRTRPQNLRPPSLQHECNFIRPMRALFADVLHDACASVTLHEAS